MINNIFSIFSLVGFVFVFAVLTFLFSCLLTGKYNEKNRNFYSLFLDVRRKNIVVEACVLLNFLFIFYFLFFSKNFIGFEMYFIIFVNVILCIVSLNWYLIIVNVLYSIVSLALIWLYSMLNDYLKLVVFDEKIAIIKLLFTIMIIIYALFITVRQTYILIDTNGGKKNEFKYL